MKRVLVLSGGGAKGAWQLGVLKALNECGVQFDTIIGTSVGALNGAGYSVIGIEKLEALWLGLEGSKSVQRCALWKLFWATGVYHFGPLRKILEDSLPEAMDHTVPAYAATLSAKDSEVKYISQYQAKNKQEYIDAIIGSSSLGFFHEPVNGDLLDGGHREAMPIRRAVEKMAASEVWAIGTEPLRETLGGFEPSFPKIASFGIRTVEIMAEETYQNDIAPYINDRRVKIITPRNALPIGGMEYDPKLIREMIKRGYERGKQICS